MPKKGSKSNAEREIELLQQQLSLKDAIIESKDAVIEAKDKLLAQRSDLASPASSSADTTAKRLAAAEARLQQLEAAANSSENRGASNEKKPAREPKRARYELGYSQPLEKDEILDEIFYLVGRREWLYAGGVCRQWRGRYLSMCYKARDSNDEHAFQTSHRSSLVTAARFSTALENGLEMPHSDIEAGVFFDDLPKLSQQPIEVLTLARVRGAAWHSNMCIDAAYFGNLELLKWLHAAGCPWDTFGVAFNTLRGNVRYSRRQYERILPWLFSTVEEWSQDDKDKLLFEAGVLFNAPALELMLA
jgi:hypothetical protein